MYTNSRSDEVRLLKDLWSSRPVRCPKCGGAQLEPLHKKDRKNCCDWKCPACGEICRTIRMLKALPAE